jgi:hypothetical protein
MYRIVKRIVHTITTVTWLVRWENSAVEQPVERQITFPVTHSLVEEEIADQTNIHEEVPQSSNPTLDAGEKS